MAERDAATLLPIIQRVAEPGTSIWSDEWTAYGQLSSLGYVHSTVNHSRNFKDLITGTCTNHVEVRDEMAIQENDRHLPQHSAVSS